MNPDEFSLSLLDRQFIYVDGEKGLAFTVRTTRGGKPKLLGTLNTKGYLVCTLWLNDVRKQIKVHRLIWLACHGEIPEGLVIDHINGNKSDNRISNLRLATPALNSQNRRTYKGEGNPACKITAEIAAQIRQLHAGGMPPREIAKRFSVSKSLIHQIRRGELWK